ncbi:hypothetical protein MBLNU13_g09317t1 [Cladosporium sp. NU13]
MYWPIGPPKAYALSKRKTIPLPSRSHDGLEEPREEEGGTAGSGEQEEDDGTNGNLNTHDEEDDTSHGHSTGDISVPGSVQDEEILVAKISRGGSVFATITRSQLTVWQTKPAVALASVIRSPQSMESYGPSTALLLRPDGLIIVVQTSLGYLITYSLSTDPNARVYATQLMSTTKHSRHGSEDGYNTFRRRDSAAVHVPIGEGAGIKEVNLRFRMVIRIDAGINTALALDDELVVATHKPAAIQCIRWVADNNRSQTSTELLARMDWMEDKSSVTEVVFDRPMNLATWLTSDGKAYAVQRKTGTPQEHGAPSTSFQGFCFREPGHNDDLATKAAINARFSLIAVGCANGNIDVYAVKDYVGNIPLSHRLSLPLSSGTTGKLTALSYSPDGYCLFAGYEKGWATWSMYGKPGANSFGIDQHYSGATSEGWLHGVRDCFWIGGGCELAILDLVGESLWTLEMARSAIPGCYSPSNVARGLLVSSTGIIMYSGHDVADLTALPSDTNLWQSVQIPSIYLVNQWPIKSAVESPDGKYVAVAGRRGLAHYSTASGRWKTFDDPANETEFSVRGGMCWYQHVLIASVEASGKYQVRMYSRDKALGLSQILHTEELSAPAISTTISGSDSLLVYTYDNILLHYIIAPSSSSLRLVQVGQIGFHGIIRAPPRVRAISWLLPEEQIEHGDPSQDVATASVLFLVDGKLVLLQPSTNDLGELKYDMRVIAQNVEYFQLMRDHPANVAALTRTSPGTVTPGGLSLDQPLGHSLRDSLWYFDGTGMHVWSDVQDVIACAPAELGRELPPSICIPLDFYPVTALVGKGIIHGLDSELIQRRDVSFSFFRHQPRTQLFINQILRHHLAEYNSPAALHLASSYQKLPYFAHALEVLLHDVLDYEVDNPPSPPETALLPATVSFLSSFTSYLDVIVNCTRKTELRSWQTLFSNLPPVITFFEQSLAQSKLKTAAGYLLVLHAFESESFQVHDFARLLRMAASAQDWDLCRELARFLVGIDATGNILRTVLTEADLEGGGLANGHGTPSPAENGRPRGYAVPGDYFSLARR